MKNYLLIITLVFLGFSCSNIDEVPVNSENLLLGNWSDAIYDSNVSTLTFKRVTSLPEEAYGVSFKEQNVFVERTSGWCGTPPLTFYNVQGSFRLNESLIEVKMEGFPGDFNWKILSLTNESLVVQRSLTNQQKDHQELMEMFDEIVTLSQSITCTNSADWSFTPYGTKACGGPQGFIAYSNKIDTVAFLQKVQVYSEAENQYNIKWDIISTCDLPAQPTSVECSNGSPVFKY